MGRIKERGYLLFMYGKFKNDEKVKNILQELVPVVSSNAVKFTWGDYGIVAYFVSNTRFVELQDFIYSHMSGKCKQYFLTEKTDKLSVHGPDDIIDHLFGSEIVGVPEVKNDIEKFNEFLEFFVMDELTKNPSILDVSDEDDNDDFKMVFKKSKHRPSLDELLEKIQINGIKALSLEEKKLLDDYSHGK
jgi:hypothetical protein